MKKKLNNRGFTLIELLAVLVILITILTIAIPSITASVERNKKNVFNKKIDIIEAQAESYVNLYKNKINYSLFVSGDKEATIDGVSYTQIGSCCINISKIVNVGLLSSDDLKDADDKPIEGFVCYDKYTNKYLYNKTNVGTSEC